MNRKPKVKSVGQFIVTAGNIAPSHVKIIVNNAPCEYRHVGQMRVPVINDGENVEITMHGIGVLRGKVAGLDGGSNFLVFHVEPAEYTGLHDWPIGGILHGGISVSAEWGYANAPDAMGDKWVRNEDYRLAAVRAHLATGGKTTPKAMKDALESVDGIEWETRESVDRLLAEMYEKKDAEEVVEE